MRPINFRMALGIMAGAMMAVGFAQAEPKHGIAMYGEPALPAEFAHLPYANPDAPKGGRISMGETGGFDSLNPFILKGNSPWQLRYLAYESLMGRSYDEPFTLYGLLAQSVEVGPNREWVEFTLRPEAKFSDGSPVTVEDVLWSYETLGTIGHPRYLGFWKKVAKAEVTGERSVKFTFNEENPELALIAGMRPILKKAQWADQGFEASGLTNIPIGTAPYVVGDFEAGRFVALRRNPDYWGKDLPFRRGTDNLDEIRIEYFGDNTAAFEAFKAGELNMHRESNANAWDEQYDFPAVSSGTVVKSVIPHQRPTGMTGFVMNTRNPLFADWRVRDAMIHAFNFEFINEAMTGNKQQRITSYFSNSPLGMTNGPASDAERALLEPFKDQLLPGALDGYDLPVSDGSARNRKNIAIAMDLLEQAGWTVQDGVLKNASGEPFAFEVLLRQGDLDNKSIMNLYSQALERLGIQMTITTIDDAQYTERTDRQDFEMTAFRRDLSLSPGNEQFLYWGKDQADQPGSRNWMGVKSDAVDGMIRALLSAKTNDEFVAATRALDRVLTTGRYVIPIYAWTQSRVAHSKNLHFPEHLPIYGDYIGFLPDVWWYQED